jgi:hypothetical protein
MGIELGYITMVRREKHLFDLPYVSGRVRLDIENHAFPMDTAVLVSVMRKIPIWQAFPKRIFRSFSNIYGSIPTD